jgi:hypothetical protein
MGFVGAGLPAMASTRFDVKPDRLHRGQATLSRNPIATGGYVMGGLSSAATAVNRVNQKS